MIFSKQATLLVVGTFTTVASFSARAVEGHIEVRVRSVRSLLCCVAEPYLLFISMMPSLTSHTIIHLPHVCLCLHFVTVFL